MSGIQSGRTFHDSNRVRRSVVFLSRDSFWARRIGTRKLTYSGWVNTSTEKCARPPRSRTGRTLLICERAPLNVRIAIKPVNGVGVPVIFRKPNSPFVLKGWFLDSLGEFSPQYQNAPTDDPSSCGIQL